MSLLELKEEINMLDHMFFINKKLKPEDKRRLTLLKKHITEECVNMIENKYLSMEIIKDEKL